MQNQHIELRRALSQDSAATIGKDDRIYGFGWLVTYLNGTLEDGWMSGAIRRDQDSLTLLLKTSELHADDLQDVSIIARKCGYTAIVSNTDKTLTFYRNNL